MESVVIDFPPGMAQLILDSPADWHGLPIISRLSATPVMMPDGRIICASGYDAGDRHLD